MRVTACMPCLTPGWTKRGVAKGRLQRTLQLYSLFPSLSMLGIPLQVREREHSEEIALVSKIKCMGVR